MGIFCKCIASLALAGLLGISPVKSDFRTQESTTAQGCVGGDPGVSLNSSEDGSLYRLYCAVFLRQPDPAGWAYWKSQSLSIWEIAELFGISPEFKNTYGEVDAEEFVSLVYLNVMSRPGDRDGYDYWIAKLESGTLSRGELVVYFSDSEEFQSRIHVDCDGTGVGRHGEAASEYVGLSESDALTRAIADGLKPIVECRDGESLVKVRPSDMDPTRLWLTIKSGVVSYAYRL